MKTHNRPSKILGVSACLYGAAIAMSSSAHAANLSDVLIAGVPVCEEIAPGEANVLVPGFDVRFAGADPSFMGSAQVMAIADPETGVWHIGLIGTETTETGKIVPVRCVMYSGRGFVAR